VGFVHKTHLTSEQAENSERLLAEAPALGLTQTTAVRLIYGEAGIPLPSSPRATSPVFGLSPPEEARRPKQLPAEPPEVAEVPEEPEEESLKALARSAKLVLPGADDDEDDEELRMTEHFKVQDEGEEEDPLDEVGDLALLVGDAPSLLESLEALRSGGIGEVELPQRVSARFPARPPPPPPS
jgi:hypothetical protein